MSKTYYLYDVCPATEAQYFIGEYKTREEAEYAVLDNRLEFPLLMIVDSNYAEDDMPF